MQAFGKASSTKSLSGGVFDVADDVQEIGKKIKGPGGLRTSSPGKNCDLEKFVGIRFHGIFLGPLRGSTSSTRKNFVN